MSGHEIYARRRFAAIVVATTMPPLVVSTIWWLPLYLVVPPAIAALVSIAWYNRPAPTALPLEPIVDSKRPNIPGDARLRFLASFAGFDPRRWLALRYAIWLFSSVSFLWFVSVNGIGSR